MSTLSPSSEKESKATKESEPRIPVGLDFISERSAINQGRDSKLSYLKWYLTSKEGWLGDYVGHDAPLRFFSECKLQYRPLIVIVGLPISHHPQHMAPEPQV